MKEKVAQGLHWLTKSRGLPLVALAVLGVVTVMPGWVRAQSETTTTFTSPLPGGPKGEHGGPNDELRELLDSIIDRDEILADVLGITVEELAAAKEAGTSIDELIANAGLDKETVHTEIKTAITEAVEQAVTDGTITQEQADLILTPPQHEDKPSPGHHGPGDGGHDPQATPTPTLVATAPADGTPEATTTAEATPTADATTAGTAATNNTGDNGDRPRPHHDQPPAQNSDASSTGTAAGDSTSSTASSESSTGDNTATANQQPSSDRPAHGGHQRPGR